MVSSLVFPSAGVLGWDATVAGGHALLDLMRKAASENKGQIGVSHDYMNATYL
jgi:hypothetical protein